MQIGPSCRYLSFGIIVCIYYISVVVKEHDQKQIAEEMGKLTLLFQRITERLGCYGNRQMKKETG